MTPKVMICCFLLLRPPSQTHNGLKHKKTTISGDFPSKIAPHRRFGGSKFLATHIFSISKIFSPFFVEKFFSISSPQKVMRCPKKIYKIRTARFLCIILKYDVKIKNWQFSALLKPKFHSTSIRPKYCQNLIFGF